MRHFDVISKTPLIYRGLRMARNKERDGDEEIMKI